MRKKFLPIISGAVIAAMLLAGCGNTGKTGNTDTTTTTAEANNETSEGGATEADQVAAKGIIEYTFADSVKDKAGYAEGELKLTVDTAGDYSLFWANEEGTLSGYYPISTEAVEADKAVSVNFKYHVAIPSDATKVIAVKAVEGKDAYSLSDAIATYDIPAEKQQAKSDKVLYTFNSISDVHIDEEKWGNAPAYWWEYSEDHWAKMLDYATAKNVDFIVSSGDQVTNANMSTLDKEWKAYEYILSESDYVNPIYESGGNHEVRQDGLVSDDLGSYVIGSGLNNDFDTISSNKSYYYITEPNTGDMFIFMSLEGGYRPAQYDEFTTEQLDWLEGLLKENYNTGKNIYIIQHVLIKGYGAGDDIDKSYYTGPGNPSLETSQRFISLCETYTDNVVWISGHSHIAYEYEYNYSNNDGKACNMIHNSAVGNPTHITDDAIDYAFHEDLSQGYYVEVFENSIVFYGANVLDQKIYPMYSYIMDGNTTQIDGKTQDEYKPVPGTTAGNLRSIIANAKTVLGIDYEYSSYNQYQSLKKLYYEYKDADIDALSEDELCDVYGNFAEKIKSLNTLVGKVSKLELTVTTTK